HRPAHTSLSSFLRALLSSGSRPEAAPRGPILVPGRREPPEAVRVADGQGVLQDRHAGRLPRPLAVHLDRAKVLDRTVLRVDRRDASVPFLALVLAVPGEDEAPVLAEEAAPGVRDGAPVNLLLPELRAVGAERDKE